MQSKPGYAGLFFGRGILLKPVVIRSIFNGPAMARIFLIGPMGSGKSSVGKSLARKLQFEFYDSDREIEARCGVDIPTIFEFEGEAGFRNRERKVLAELAELDNAVIATGGGAILNRANRKTLRDSGHVILLAVDLEEQLRRVSLNKNRPLLQVGDVEAKLRSLMEERRSLYESTAHHVVSTNSSRMQNVVAKITRHLVRSELVSLPAPPAAKTPASKPSPTKRGRGPGRRVSGNVATTSSPAKPKSKSTGNSSKTKKTNSSHKNSKTSGKSPKQT